MSDDTVVNTNVPTELIQPINEDIASTINIDQAPKPVDDLFKRMNIEKLVLTDVGPNVTIDVQPDFRPILVQLVDHVTKIFQQIEQMKIPILTPASYLAYSLHNIYIYGTLADVYNIRAVASKYGNDILNDKHGEQAINVASWNFTPTYNDEILRGLQYTFDPRRKNIAFIYSFAAFSFDHDFGKAFPIHMFLNLHNLICQFGDTETSDTIWRIWINSIVVQDANTVITVANIIGAAYNEHYIENFVNKKLKQLLTMTMATQRTKRIQFCPIPITTYPVVEDLSHINPYYYLLGFVPELNHSVVDFLNEMSAHTKTIFKDCKMVGEYYGLESGVNILNHYYTDFCLPTYHQLKVAVTAKSKPTTIENYATALKFMCASSTARKASNAVTPSKARSGNDFKINTSLYLLEKSTGIHDTTDPDPVVLFNKHKHEAPILLYSPWSTGLSSLYYPVICGLTIESHEIDAFHVPFPNMTNNIRHENSYFLQSAMPFRCAIDRSFLTGHSDLSVRTRSQEQEETHKVSFSFDDMSKHALPRFSTRVAASDPTNLLPGFTAVHGVRSFENGSNKVAYQGNTAWTKVRTDEVFPDSQLIWSSYRWIDPTKSCIDNFYQYKYFIMNLRTLYGTTPRIVQAPQVSKILKT